MKSKFLPLRKRADFVAVQNGEKRRGALFLLAWRLRPLPSESAETAAAIACAPDAAEIIADRDPLNIASEAVFAETGDNNAAVLTGSGDSAAAIIGGNAVSMAAHYGKQDKKQAPHKPHKKQTPQFVPYRRNMAETDVPAAAMPRIGFTVTRKNGNAVCRNRIKRRLRAAVQSGEIIQFAALRTDYVIIARAEILSVPFVRLVEELRRRFEKTHSAEKMQTNARGGGKKP